MLTILTTVLQMVFDLLEPSKTDKVSSQHDLLSVVMGLTSNAMLHKGKSEIVNDREAKAHVPLFKLHQ